jgi:hypothetical protein
MTLWKSSQVDFRCMADLTCSHVKAIYRLYNKTDMYFLAGEYDVICTEKIILTWLLHRSILSFSVHIISY